ncbi:hypothetical protein QYF36_009138 [Acer negundo]|nr:hypothetical protein QYF36_009138 [Acer negundo]
MVGLEMANTNGLESFGSTRKHTGNRIVNDRKADNGYAASVEGKIDHVKHTNGSKNVRGSVSKLKKSSDSKFDILSEEVDTVMAEGRVVGESSNKEVGNNKIKGNVLKKVTIHVSCFSPMDGAYRDVNISLKPLDMANDYLAPSVPNPVSLLQFRPINLCNTSYKLINKILVQRLRIMLPDLVSPNQVAFVPRR